MYANEFETMEKKYTEMKNELQHLFCVNGPPLRKQFYSKVSP